MGTVRYTVLDGEVISERRNGVLHDYMVDPLGSTIGLVDSTQSVTDTFAYSPFGEVVSRTGTTATPFQYVGSQGYYKDSSSRSYVRARTFNVNLGRWMTQDPIGFEGGDYNLYRYVKNTPIMATDIMGMGPIIPPRRYSKYDNIPTPPPLPPLPFPDLSLGGKIKHAVFAAHCAACGVEIYQKWYKNPTHYCNHAYAHCMACCALTETNSWTCAWGLQHGQNLWRRYQRKPDDPEAPPRRLKLCQWGIYFGLQGRNCHLACSQQFPVWRNKDDCNNGFPYLNHFPPLSGICSPRC